MDQKLEQSAPVEKLTYTVRETAKILGIGINPCYEAVRTGQIPNVRIGARILVPRAALDRMLRKTEE